MHDVGECHGYQAEQHIDSADSAEGDITDIDEEGITGGDGIGVKPDAPCA